MTYVVELVTTEDGHTVVEIDADGPLQAEDRAEEEARRRHKHVIEVVAACPVGSVRRGRRPSG